MENRRSFEPETKKAMSLKDLPPDTDKKKHLVRSDHKKTNDEKNSKEDKENPPQSVYDDSDYSLKGKGNTENVENNILLTL